MSLREWISAPPLGSNLAKVTAGTPPPANDDESDGYKSTLVVIGKPSILPINSIYLATLSSHEQIAVSYPNFYIIPYFFMFFNICF